MDYIMTNHQLAGKLLHIANNVKTLYVLGGIGYPLNEKGKKRAMNIAYNAQAERKKMIEAASHDTFAFDCVCMVKSVLWGFDADPKKTYGGALYASNGIPDCTIDALYKSGSKHSTDMTDIAVGEFLVLHSHHCGVYVGNGMVVECTPAWKNCVQVTKLTSRRWKKHCYLPYVKYEEGQDVPYPNKTDAELAYMVIHGQFGNGDDRKKALGVRYRVVQDIVNQILKKGAYK